MRGWREWGAAVSGRWGKAAIKGMLWLGVLSALVWASGAAAKAGSAPRFGSPPVAATPGQFTTEHFTDPSGAHMTYYLYVPAHYSPSASYPLVLVLHGTGERALATRTTAQNRAALLDQGYVRGWVSATVQSQWPSFVVVPQISGPTARWVDSPGNQGAYALASDPTIALETAIDITATVARAYAGVNAHQLLVAGISMGAYGVWDAAERWPTLFAAAAPVAGAGDPRHARVLANLPLWDFHGAADTNVPVAGSRAMYAAIHAAGGHSCYTEYPGQAHGIWASVSVYSDPTFLAWFFAQSTAHPPGQHAPTCAGLSVGGVVAR